MLRDHYGDSDLYEGDHFGYDSAALALYQESTEDRGLVELTASWLEQEVSAFDLCGNLNANDLCAKVSSISLNIEKIAEQLNPILEKFVNIETEKGYLDEICIPLGELNKVIEPLAELTGQSWTMLDIAEMFLGDKSGAPTVRTILKIYEDIKEFAKSFSDGEIVLAEECDALTGFTCCGGVAPVSLSFFLYASVLYTYTVGSHTTFTTFTK
jgi:hypothetical protein